MKQEIITYLSTLKNDLFKLARYLYNNPEESFKEYKAYNYIISLLKEYNFEIKENYLGINTAFYAQYGNSYPKICYICEYDADPYKGHISGNNLVSTMSIGAALSLSKVISKTGGSIVVLGCPGEYINGCKTTMVKQGTFEDIDVVLMAHPHVITTNTLPSMSVLPVKIKFDLDNNTPINCCSSLDSCMLTHNFIDLVNKNLPKGYKIQNIFTNGVCNSYSLYSKCESNYLITTPKIENSYKILEIIKSFISLISNIFELKCNISIYQLPYEEMILNENLCRIFSHNLKECGIINISSSNETLPGLSIGSVSHILPCINPFVSITENASIGYPSQAFGKETLKDFAINNTMKTIQALSLTGLDLIQNENLLKEIKQEFNHKKKQEK
ncbi:M20 family peptidase [Haloimpatiens sp. FM7330]|uniref:M20 family peptidase n=1 Tax=Haloimpatiens sp. FM7330 TaxID=3298610 RepID=UPI0036273612